jgi:HlyD family secretion protein
MENSNFKEGNTIATISDMSTFLFQGKVGEMEVVYLHPGMQFEVSLTAIKGKKFPATLTKIAPKALESEGDRSIKFAIEGTVQINIEDKESIRAGYTATADIALDKAINVLAIKERCVHTEEIPRESTPFVWVYENNKNLKKHVELGVSDGIYVEVKKGLTANDQVITEDDSH